RDGSRPFALGAAVVAVAGLLLTLFVRPRRVWVRVEEGEDGRSRVVLAGLGKTEVAADNQELHELTTRRAARLRDETDDNPDSAPPESMTTRERPVTQTPGREHEATATARETTTPPTI